MLYLKAFLGLFLLLSSIPFFLVACLCLLCAKTFGFFSVTFGRTANIMLEYIGPEDFK